LWSKAYLVAMSKFMLADTIALESDAVQALSILNEPGATLPANPRMHTRDALRRYLNVIATETTDSHDGLIEWMCASDFAIDLDKQASGSQSLSVFTAWSRLDIIAGGCYWRQSALKWY
jgi:hypothetical protein